jgi:hypothetical protein
VKPPTDLVGALACILFAVVLLGFVLDRSPRRQCALWSETPSTVLAGRP